MEPKFNKILIFFDSLYFFFKGFEDPDAYKMTWIQDPMLEAHWGIFIIIFTFTQILKLVLFFIVLVV